MEDEHALRVCAGRKTCSLNLSPFTCLLGSIRSDQLRRWFYILTTTRAEPLCPGVQYTQEGKSLAKDGHLFDFCERIFGLDFWPGSADACTRSTSVDEHNPTQGEPIRPTKVSHHPWMGLSPSIAPWRRKQHAECACDGCASSIVSSHIYCTYSNDG